MDPVNLKPNAEDARFESYEKLLRLRRMVILLFFFPAIFMVSTGVASSFFGEWLSVTHDVFMHYFPIPYIVVLYLTMWYVSCGNICPWCGYTFFGKNMGLATSFGLDLLFRRSCANCGKPEYPTRSNNPS